MKNIIIYPHLPFNFSDGGTTVQYELAKTMSAFGANVKIFTSNGKTINSVYNHFTSDKNYSKEDTVVIYCEGIVGNPLNAKYVVRWMLSELGKHIPDDRKHTWAKTDFVYYFNSEKKFDKHPEFMGKIYKMLTSIYINPLIRNYNNPFRKGYCHTFRKIHFHKNLQRYAHPRGASTEITRQHTQLDYINIFNKKDIFICYDPLTFLSIIAAMCGCISVVIKVDGIPNQSEWLKTTGVANYVSNKNLNRLYGIAYGIDEIPWARETIHLVKKQWEDVILFFKENTVKLFLKDLENIDDLKNTVKNNFFDSHE